MSDDPKRVTCGEHGTATTTYVCSHLADDPMRRWHSSRASPDNRWPDWNERNFNGIDLRILCHYCYERALGESVSRLEGEQLEIWRSFVESCREELRVKQEALDEPTRGIDGCLGLNL